VEQTGTLACLDALHALGVLDTNEQEALRGAFVHIANLLLQQQIADFRVGKKVTYFLHPDSLSKRIREQLVDGMKAIGRLRDRVRAELTGNLS
jgi:signal-transduction protein with cAMP-binding, CBS, and nucleotidyltransferase domain